MASIQGGHMCKGVRCHWIPTQLLQSSKEGTFIQISSQIFEVITLKWKDPQLRSKHFHDLSALSWTWWTYCQPRSYLKLHEIFQSFNLLSQLPENTQGGTIHTALYKAVLLWFFCKWSKSIAVLLLITISHQTDVDPAAGLVMVNIVPEIFRYENPRCYNYNLETKQQSGSLTQQKI